jgi:hypothetical protein
MSTNTEERGSETESNGPEEEKHSSDSEIHAIDEEIATIQSRFNKQNQQLQTLVPSQEPTNKVLRSEQIFLVLLKFCKPESTETKI